MLLVKEQSKAYKQWFTEDWPKMTDEQKHGYARPIEYWTKIGRGEWLEENQNDPKKFNDWKETFRKENKFDNNIKA